MARDAMNNYSHLMADDSPLLPLEKSRWLGAGVAGLGLCVILGWVFDQPLWTTVFPGLSSMKFNTAVCFIALGSGQYATIRDWTRHGAPKSRWVLAAPLLVASISGLTLVEYLAGVSFGIDEVFHKDHLVAVGAPFPGRMASNSAASILFSSLALILLRIPTGRVLWAANGFSIASLLIALAGMVGYLFSIPEWYTIKSATQMALHTAVGLFILNLAALSSHSRMLLARLLLARGIGAWLLKRLGLFIIVVPFLLGDLLLDSMLEERFSPSFAVAVLTAGIIALLLVALVLAAVSLEKLDAARAKAEREKESLLDQLRRYGQELESTVKVRTASLEEANRNLEKESGERQSSAERLEDALARLQRTLAELRQYAMVASRDLMEPLQKIAGSLHLLARKLEPHLDAEAHHLIREAQSDSDRMQALIRDFLDFAKLGEVEPRKVRINLEHVLTEVLDMRKQQPRYEKARITSGPLPVVLADPGQAAVLLGHLLDNAVTFRGPNHPRIHVEAVREKEDWIISVSDNGIGIASEDHESIFGMFRKLHSREVYPGSGMGLAVSRKIAERHGGALTVESVPGRGAVFRLRWPMGHIGEGIP